MKESLFSLDRESVARLKGIAILLVLTGHLMLVPWGGAGGVNLFLFLSGYGVALSVQKNGLAGYWQKKIRKVWIPYVGAAMIQILVRHVKNYKAILCTLIGLDLRLNCDKTMWFISVIFLEYLAFYLAVLVTRRIKNRDVQNAITIAWLLIAAFVIRRLYYTVPIWNWASGIARYVWAFPLGVFFGEYGQLPIGKKANSILWSTSLFVLLVYLIPNYGAKYDALMGMALALLPLTVSQLFRRDYSERKSSVLSWLGKYSFSIYLFEALFLDYREQWFGILGSPLLVSLAYILATAGAAFLYWEGIYGKLMEQFSPKT